VIKYKNAFFTVSLMTALAGGSSRANPTPKETTASPPEKLGVLAPGTGIAVGERVPDVHARDLNGKDVRLSAVVAQGPVLLVFYRGGWCPFCNFQIRELTRAYPEYQKRGIRVVAVSVDKPDEASKTNATYAIPFPVLSDSDLSMIQGFHVAMHMDDAQLAKMKSFGVDLEQYSGKGHHTIAIPSLFLIDSQGVVRWAHSDPSYTQRPTTSQILAAIDGVHLSI
jgi:peroxiredoxin